MRLYCVTIVCLDICDIILLTSGQNIVDVFYHHVLINIMHAM
jgi:hypothetical protein